jgi:hypothetical protein
MRETTSHELGVMREARTRRVALIVLALMLTSACAGGVCGDRASAAPTPRKPLRPPLPQGEGVAIVGGGAVWFDEGRIVFQRFAGGGATVGWGRQYSPPWLESSAGSVAGVLGEGRFVAGMPPGRVRPMYQPEGVPGGECAGGWVPEAGFTPNFVVVGKKIISAGRCQSGEQGGFEAEAQTRQPLFSHDVRGGDWHVWRWLSADAPPVLAAEGNRLAVGEIVQPPLRERLDEGTRQMRVSIIDIRNGTVSARFVTPAGSLAFAAPDRLVLSIVTEGATPPRLLTSINDVSPVLRLKRTYHLWLYATSGRRITGLGTFQALPSVSHMHLLTEGQVLSVRAIPGGTPSPLIGFNAPQRTLDGLAFHWPALALRETAATALQADQLNCGTGYYSPASRPFLQVIDLARAHTYEPPPPPSPLESQHLLAHCPQVRYQGIPRTR